MISERTFAESYTTFWRQLLPGSTRYMRFINGSASQRVSEAIPADSRPEIRSVMSQTAFNFVRMGFNKIEISTLADDVILKSSLWKVSLSEAQDFISQFDDRPESLDFEAGEERECISLARTTWQHLRAESHNKVLIFEPTFPGWGLLNASKGDALIDNCLIEIKAVERVFGISDIRQILVYGALNYLTNTNPNLDCFELYNPRLGRRYNDSFDDFAQGVAGCSSEELFLEISRQITDKISSL